MNNTNTISSEEMDSNRIVYLDLLRVLSIFSVIVIHIASENWHITDVTSFDWQVYNFYDSLSRWGVPVFVMISGTLFLSRNIPIKTLYTKYIRKTVMLFIIWSFGYAFLFKIIVKHSLRGFVVSFLRGHYHMWFLFMIVGLYMIIPFLRVIIQNKKLVKYYLLLSFFFALVIPQSLSIISVFSEKYGLAAQKLVDNVNLYFVLGFSIYFILGHYINTISISRQLQRCIFILGIISFISTIILSSAVSIYKKEPVDVFYNYKSVNVFFESISVFTLFKSKLNKVHLSQRSLSIMKNLSKYTLGVYLVHPFYITVLIKVTHFSSTSMSYVFFLPLLSIVVFVISYITSALLNHIPFIKNLV